ncbi:MAG: DUF1232 domain-containing protein [Cyclobacteriaceae bacterium]
MNLQFLNSPIFSLAINKAQKLVGNRSRLLLLLAQAFSKMSQVKNRGKLADEIKFKFHVLTRMLKAFAVGEYRSVPWNAIVGIAATLIYFINPADLIPDFVPFTGFADDFGILLWMFNSIQNEIDAFLSWEEHQMPIV